MKGQGYKVTSAFPEPNYTQTPNDFFSMIPDMGEAELRVTLVMIRETFGFHRDGFKMGVTKLAKAAGLSRQGALDGAAAAETRGTFRRTNPEAITEAEWELVVDLHPVDPSSQFIPTLQPVEGTPQVGGGQVGVKESKESNKEIADAILQDLSLENQIFLGKLKVQHSRTDNIKNALRDYFKLTPRWASKFDREWLEWALSENVTAEQIKSAALLWGKDKRFNWAVPTLKGIAEHWLELIGTCESIVFTPEPDWMADARRRSERVNA